MHCSALFLLFLLPPAFAYQVTEPSASKGWTDSGAQILTWTRVNTDPSTFTVVLTNEDRSVLPHNNQVLAAQVDGNLETVSLQPPSGGWPTGGTFRVNLVKNTEELDTILAQSGEFDIGPLSDSTTLSSTQISTSLTSLITRTSATTTQTGTQATTRGTGQVTTSATIVPSTPSAGEDPVQSNIAIKEYQFYPVLVTMFAVLSFALA